MIEFPLILNKENLLHLVNELCDNVKPFYIKNNTRALIESGNLAHYTKDKSEIEFFSRTLYGIMPLLVNNQQSEYMKIFIQGILSGTNPISDSYWGEIEDFDQLEVEMIPIIMCLYVTKSKTWDKFDKTQRKNIINWFEQINNVKIGKTNWLFFRLIVNLFIGLLTNKYNEEIERKTLKQIDKLYIGNGWYEDGENGNKDYYIAFAFHFYSLIYVKFVENKNERKKIFIERAKKFADEFIYWFSNDGSAIPYGRSLTYRFAQSAFWAIAAYVDEDILPIEVLKGIIFRNLRWWFNKSIFDERGILTLGYCYPNLNMTEEYNAFGSSYWAFKTFIFLLLPNDHKFWKVDEAKLPKRKKKKEFLEAEMVICGDLKSEHILMFPTNNNSLEFVHGEAKYHKFVYSNKAGFSVPRSNIGLSNYSVDSTITFSRDNKIFISRNFIDKSFNINGINYSKYKPLPEVIVESYIYPEEPWHIRIHRINTKKSIHVYDSGFSINSENELLARIEDKKNAVINGEEFISRITSLVGDSKGKIVKNSSNTNLLFRKSEVPVMYTYLKPGTYIIVNAVMGKLKDNVIQNDLNKCPSVLGISESKVKILFEDKEIIIPIKGYTKISKKSLKTNIKNGLKNIVKKLN